MFKNVLDGLTSVEKFYIRNSSDFSRKNEEASLKAKVVRAKILIICDDK